MRTLAVVLVCLVLVLVTTPVAWAQEFAWARQLGGTSYAVGRGVAVDSSGNVYTVGYFAGTADFDPGPGTYNLTAAGPYDVFISKLDSAGNFVWARQLGGASEEHGTSVAVDVGGNVYTVGYFNGTVDFDPGPGTFSLTSAGGYDAFVSKLDSAGNFVWAKHLGGVSDDFASGVALDASGNAYTVGLFQGTADFDPGPGTYNLTSAGGYEVFVSKLDTAGNFVWARQMGGAGNDNANGVALDASGNVYTTGYFSATADFDPGPGTYNLTAAGPASIFISKLDSAGNFVWARQLAGPRINSGQGVALDSRGNVYTVGLLQGTADFDPGPGTYNLTAAGYTDEFISKLDSDGNFVWARLIGGSSASTFAYGVALDSSGNVYTTGEFGVQYTTVDFDPGPSTYYLTCLGMQDVFVSKLDSAGNFAWAGQFGGAQGNNFGYGVALDASGNVYTTGSFSATADFDPGPGTYNLTAAGPYDIFVSKLRNCAPLVDQSAYGQLLFPPLCTRDAASLTQDVYSSLSLGMFAGTNDRFYLSSSGGTPTGQILGPNFSPLVVDDAVHINGVDASLGPYSYQPGVPPFFLDAPIELNLVPLPSHEVTTLIPTGQSSVTFDLVDTDRLVYGNTAVYLVRDCGIWLAGDNPTSINWITHDDEVAGTSPEFDVRYGFLSNLRADRNFSRASCLGHYLATPATESLSDPPVGDGYYYLTRGLSSCVQQGYGDSSLVPDPRDALDALPACP